MRVASFVKNSSLYQRFSRYYEGKNMTVRIVFAVFLLFILILLLWGPKNVRVLPTASYDYTIAGEWVPMDGVYFFNRERLDREFAITRLDDAQFVITYRRSGKYLPYIRQELSKHNMPADLQYIPVIESALREDAVSSAWAAGMWQFMPATARSYGLVVDEYIDERYDWQKSTDAALDYLQSLYARFGNWTDAIAAYNRGENGLQRDYAWQNSAWYYDAWLNTETARYIFRLVATKYLMEDALSYFSEETLGDMYRLPSTKTVSVRWPVESLVDWSEEEGYSYAEIRQLNPWIRSTYLPEWRWEIDVFSLR